MPNNLPFDLQDQDSGERLGDIKGLAAGISECSEVATQGDVTPSTTQTQAGGTLIRKACIRIARGAANDAVTLGFRALAGKAFVLMNDSGQTIRLFPAVGDKINDALTNAQVDIANNTISEYFCPVYGLWFGGPTTFET